MSGGNHLVVALGVWRWASSGGRDDKSVGYPDIGLTIAMMVVHSPVWVSGKEVTMDFFSTIIDPESKASPVDICRGGDNGGWHQ